jgi:hypothetical protein
MNDSSELPFSWLIALFLLGFLTPVLEVIGRSIVRRLPFYLGTTEPGYAIIGGTSIGLVFGVAKGLFDTITSLFGPTGDFASLLTEPIEYTFKGIVAGVVISIAHTFLNAYLLLHPSSDYFTGDHPESPDSTETSQSDDNKPKTIG